MANALKNTSVLAGVTATTVYTVPGAGVTATIIPTIILANISGIAQASVTLELYISLLAQTVTLLLDAPVPIGSALLMDKPVFMQPNDILKVTAGAINSIQATIGYVETS